MRAITGRDEMLALDGAGPTTRLLALARALTGEDLSGQTLATWEGALLDLRAAVMGPRVEAELACPACGVRVALIFPVRDLPRQAPTPPEAPLPLHDLTAGDLAALEAAGLLGEAALTFLVTRAAGIDVDAAQAALSGPDRDALTAALEVRVAGLSLDLATRCTDCAAPIEAPFDVAAFLDAELQARAARVLDEVHLIATAYHWSEAEILGLTFRRRQDYIARILAERSGLALVGLSQIGGAA